MKGKTYVVTWYLARVSFVGGPTAVEKMPSGWTATFTSGRAAISSAVHVDVMAIGAPIVSSAGSPFAVETLQRQFCL